jgi:arylsulfatase A-like enzyme
MKPNVLVIHCHDLGDLIGCYPGNSARTPNLNRLAAEGVVFEQYFAAAPTCSPSRGTMLTGLTPHRNGLMGLASGGHWEVPAETPTLPRLFREAGYATASYGTWHISADFAAYGVEQGTQEGPCELLAERAMRFMRERPASKPFFLMVGFREPHRAWGDPNSLPWKPERAKIPGYLADAPAVEEEMRQFYADVGRMDAAVGALLEYLDREGLAESTLLIFTADHGIAMPLSKGTLYDPGCKIALIARWPGKIAGGRRCNALAWNVDLLPTLLEGAGEAARIPAGLDGRSLWPYLSAGEKVGREAVYPEQTWHDFYEPIRAIRTRDYKLIRNYEPGRGLQIAVDIRDSPTVNAMRQTLRAWPRPAVELYDLAADPLERRNLAGDPALAEVEKSLAAKLDAWLQETNDPILNGVVPAPIGYWEHFCAKPAGPGGLPPAPGEEGWLIVRWPRGATKHRCVK